MISDANISEDLGAGPDNNTIPQRGVPFAALSARSAKGHSLINRHVFSCNRRLADHDPHAVIDKEPGPKPGTGMDFDARQKPGKL